MANPIETRAPLDAAEVRRLCGEILDWKVDAIVTSGATHADVAKAVAWLTGESDVMGEARAPLEGKAAIVYDLLAAGEDFAGDEDSAPDRS
jgi:hypothetical protein